MKNGGPCDPPLLERDVVSGLSPRASRAPGCAACRRRCAITGRLAGETFGAEALHVRIHVLLRTRVLGHGLFGVLLTHQVTFGPLFGSEPVRFGLLICHGEITRGTPMGSSNGNGGP